MLPSLQYWEIEASLRTIDTWRNLLPDVRREHDAAEVLLVSEGRGWACNLVQVEETIVHWRLHLYSTDAHHQCTLETFMKRNMPLLEDSAA